MIWKETLALGFEVHDNIFMQCLWKDDRKTNHNFGDFT